MTSPSQRTTKIKALFKALQKRVKHVAKTPNRTVLEHLVYAACLENATFEAADSAFSVLEHHYIDWNEVRVSTVAELADTFPQLPDPMAAGERVRKTLQAVFEATYLFDLEELRKKNISQAMEYIHSIPACTRFMADYTNQTALGGHVIPLDELSLRIFRLLDLVQINKERSCEETPGLERTIPKTHGVLFATILHQFASEFFESADDPNLRSFLKAIDPESVKRTCEAPVLAPPSAPPAQEKPKTPLPKDAFRSVAVVSADDDFDSSDDETLAVREIDFIPSTFAGCTDSSLPFEEEYDDEKPSAKNTGKKKKADSKQGKPPKSVDLTPEAKVAAKTDAKQVPAKEVGRKTTVPKKQSPATKADEQATDKNPSPSKTKPAAPPIKGKDKAETNDLKAAPKKSNATNQESNKTDQVKKDGKKPDFKAPKPSKPAIEEKKADSKNAKDNSKGKPTKKKNDEKESKAKKKDASPDKKSKTQEPAKPSATRSLRQKNPR